MNENGEHLDIGKISRTNMSKVNRKSLVINGLKNDGVEGGAIIKLKDDKKYMLKGLYKEKGKYLYKPNAENKLKAFFTRKDIDGVNKSVIEEYVALKLSNVVSKLMLPNDAYEGISPNVKLGKIKHKGEKVGECKCQYCLMTEMAGQGDPKRFKKVQEIRHGSLNAINEEIWQSAFAVSVLLLNDRDVNKADNVGVVYKDNKATNLSLYDLGHPTPDKYELDPKTLLPKSMNILEKVVLWMINLFVKTNGWQFKIDENIRAQLGTEKDRARTIENLISKENKSKILKALDDIKDEFQDPADKKRIDEFKSKIEKRFKHLENVLGEYKKANEK